MATTIQINGNVYNSQGIHATTDLDEYPYLLFPKSGKSGNIKKVIAHIEYSGRSNVGTLKNYYITLDLIVGGQIVSTITGHRLNKITWNSSYNRGDEDVEFPIDPNSSIDLNQEIKIATSQYSNKIPDGVGYLYQDATTQSYLTIEYVPGAQVYYGVNGEWRPVTVYYGNSGTWKETQVHYGTGGVWKP